MWEAHPVRQQAGVDPPQKSGMLCEPAHSWHTSSRGSRAAQVDGLLDKPLRSQAFSFHRVCRDRIVLSQTPCNGGQISMPPSFGVIRESRVDEPLTIHSPHDAKIRDPLRLEPFRPLAAV